MIPKTCKKPVPDLHSCGCQKQIAGAICCRVCLVLSTSIELFPRGSQSPWSSSLCQGARLLPSTPTQFDSARNGLSSIGLDPIFTNGMKMQIWHLVSPIHLKTCCRSSQFCYHVESTECVRKIPTSLNGVRPG